jgi:hypothetical protein
MVSRVIGGPLGTILVGILAGFVASSAFGVVVEGAGLFGSSGESPIARTYMLGLLQRDPSSIAAIRPNQDIAQRAMELQGAAQAQSASMQPLSLTYLGGSSIGSVSVHIYAVGVRTSTGVDQFFPLALTVADGKVIRSE